MISELVKKTLRARTAEWAAGARADTSCARLWAGRRDGRDGLIIDRYGPLITVTDYAAGAAAAAGPQPDASAPASPDEWMDLLRQLAPEARVIVKARRAGDASLADGFVCLDSGPSSSAGATEGGQTSSGKEGPSPLFALERGLRFELGTDPAHDFGLFLDAAKARSYVRGVARGRHVLNLFAYTAGFGVAAAVGGAAAVTNVDPNRDYLAWALRNAALNGVGFRVLPDTAQAFLARHLRRLARSPAPPRFELVIVDPPTFGVGRGRERLTRLLWPEIFTALRAMAPLDLVLLCNDKSFRTRRSFADLAADELGARYRFTRLGTCFSLGELALAAPPLTYGNATHSDGEGDEDSHYVEPVVLAGTRRA